MDNILSNKSPFNSEVELGLRALVILVSSYPKAYKLHDLVILDYFLVHSKDLSDDSEESLHPQVPFRSGELLIKRNNLEKGLHLYMHKGLIELDLSDQGFEYRASDSSKYFLDLLSNNYTMSLTKKADWLSEKFKKITENELNRIIDQNLKSWHFDTFSETNLIKGNSDD